MNLIPCPHLVVQQIKCERLEGCFGVIPGTQDRWAIVWPHIHVNQGCFMEESWCGPVYRGLRVTVRKCHSTCLMYIRLKVAVQKGCGMAQDMLLTVQNLFRTSDLSPGLEDATLSRAHTILGSRTFTCSGLCSLSEERWCCSSAMRARQHGLIRLVQFRFKFLADAVSTLFYSRFQ